MADPTPEIDPRFLPRKLSDEVKQLESQRDKLYEYLSQGIRRLRLEYDMETVFSPSVSKNILKTLDDMKSVLNQVKKEMENAQR